VRGRSGTTGILWYDGHLARLGRRRKWRAGKMRARTDARPTASCPPSSPAHGAAVYRLHVGDSRRDGGNL